MSLLIPDDAAQLARQRDRMLADAQGAMEDAAAAAIQQLLRQMRRAVRQQSTLTASTPQLPRMTSDFLTLGQVSGWWAEAVDENLTARIIALWQAGRASATDADLTVRSLDAAADYVAVVRDRLSRTATPTIPDEAFATVRTALVDELARGSSVREITDRLGAELQWQGQDVGFWQDRRATADRQIASILDTAGPQFVTDPATGRRIENPARRDLRLNDPTVRQLQRESTEAGNRVARDRSTWQTRAERIARTETTGAFNAGADQAYAEEGAAVKMWLCAPDARTRDAHLAANGTCVSTDDSFDVDGEFLSFPGDPSGSAGNVINCRCTTIGGPSCEVLKEIALPAIVEVDHERALREDAQREPVTVDEIAAPAPTMTVAEASQAPDALDVATVSIVDPDGSPAPALRELDPADRDDKVVFAEDQISQRSWQRNVLDRQEVWAEELTAEEVQAMQDYAGTGNYRTVNAGLREGRLEEMSEDTRAIVDNLDSAIEKSELRGDPDLDGALIVYRSFDDPELMSRLAAGEDIIGDVLTDAAYVSTSASKNIAESFLFETATGAPISGPRIIAEIELPPGTKGAVLDAAGLGAGEREVLLPRGSRFEVVDAARSGNRIEMSLRIVADD